MSIFVPRLMLDSNIVTDGLVSRWGMAKAVLALCAAKTCRLVLAEYVRLEVERNLVKHIDKLEEEEAEQLIADYERLIKLTRPVKVPLATAEEIEANRHLIRHAADIPVVLAALQAKPDWLITMNRKHFTDEVAQKTGLRIASPEEFFEQLIKAFEG